MPEENNSNDRLLEEVLQALYKYHTDLSTQIGELRVEMNQRFTEVNHRFDRLEKDFKIYKRLINSQFADLAQDVSLLEDRVEEIEQDKEKKQ